MGTKASFLLKYICRCYASTEYRQIFWVLISFLQLKLALTYSQSIVLYGDCISIYILI
jgi:hypothetical protein